MFFIINMEIGFLTLFKAILNTLVRLLPVGLYTGSAMAGLMFQDMRGVILFIGFILNEFISLGYRMAFKGVYNPQCALLRSEDSNFILPSPITQTVGFYVAFILLNMYYNDYFEPITFFLAICVSLVTIWSRNNVGCKSIMDGLFATSIGLFFGMSYYLIVKDYFKKNYHELNTTPEKEKSISDLFFE